MDSKLSDDKAPRPLRRSTRQTWVKGVSYEPTPRGPLKRSKRASESPAPAAVVNGSKDVENGSEDAASPAKKNRLDRSDSVGGSGDENGMDVQESSQDFETEQELQMGQDSSHGLHLPTLIQGAIGDVNLSPRVVLGERCRSRHAVTEHADGMKTKIVKPRTTELAAPIKSAVQTRSSLTRHDVTASKITSMAEYKSTMEAKAKSAGLHIINQHAPNKYPASENSYSETITTRQRLNNNTTQKETIQHKNQGIKKTAVAKRKSKCSCRAFLCWCFLLVLLCSGTFLAYMKIPVLQRLADKRGRLYTAIETDIFKNHLSDLESRFPSQRPELWKRSKIHLERHLKMAQPSEPVSLILTAGHKAERTLHCLAKGLASSFSSVLNASVLHIDGASKAKQDSDEVKLDIDQELEAAFAGDKPVAVIHRLEELPPGSTLIFYRYCDHENAAFKQVFLLFTVLLPQDEVSRDQSLQSVEELVQDHVQKKLVGSDDQAAFNKMDTNKFGGLWSRISHLILPVVFEEEIQRKGCN